MRMRAPTLIASDLREWMEVRGYTELELVEKLASRKDGLTISQPWISRILSGKFRRAGRAVREVAAYASIPIYEKNSADPAGAKVIERAIKSCWNGSRAHADLIAKLISVARSFPMSDNH